MHGRPDLSDQPHRGRRGVSLNAQKQLLFPPEGLSLAWYTELLTESAWLVPIQNSVVIAALSSLASLSIDREIVEAAETMGADSRVVFRTVVFPMVKSYMVSGCAFCFVLSLNEYIVAYMVSGFTVETLPIKIFNALRYGYTPVMASVSVVFVLLAALVFRLIGRFGDLPLLLGAMAPEK